ncbi:MAG: hypothetical protein Kow0069_36190 [Promethearchaeota archaeon]
MKAGEKDSDHHVIFFLVDDVQGRLFFEKVLADPNLMPHVRADLLDRGATCADVLSLFPSASMQGHTTLLTGRYADGHEILTGAFWDVNGEVPKRVNLASVGPGTIDAWNGRIACKTIFEFVPDSTSFHVVNRGAAVKFFRKRSLIKFALAYLRLKLKGMKYYLTATKFWENLVLGNAKRWLKKLQGNSLTRLVQITFPPSDNAAHVHGMVDERGELTDGYKAALRLLDETYDVLVNGYVDRRGRRVPGLKQLGYYEKTLFVVASDHASRAYRHEFPLVDHIRRAWPFPVANLYDERGRVVPPRGETPGDLERARVLVGEEGGIAAFHVRDPATGRFPAWLPERALRNYPLEGGAEKVDVIQLVLDLPHVGHAHVRVAEDAFLVVSRGAVARVTWRLEGNVSEFSYEISEGSDPLGYLNDGRVDQDLLDGQFHDDRAWLRGTKEHAYPGVPEILARYFLCRFAAPVVAVAEDGWNFWIRPEEVEKRYQHDRDHRLETMVPLLLAGPGVRPGHVVDCCKNVDVVPTILHWLGVPFDPAEFDGKPLLEVFDGRESGDERQLRRRTGIPSRSRALSRPRPP